MKKDHQQDQKKKAQQDKDNAQAAKSFCKTCKMEIYPAFLCGCGGGCPGGGAGGGGDSGANGSDKSELKSTNVTSAKDGISSERPSVIQNNGKDWSKFTTPVLTPRETMLKIIAELLAKKLLTIDDNKALCTLTIKCDPKLLSDLQRAAVKDFVNELKKELEDFKDKNGLTDKDCTMKSATDDNGDIISFSINIPNPKLYNQFIDQLQKNNLIPSQEMSQQEKLSNNDSEKPFHPTPLPIKLKPDGFED